MEIFSPCRIIVLLVTLIIETWYHSAEVILYLGSTPTDHNFRVRECQRDCVLCTVHASPAFCQPNTSYVENPLRKYFPLFGVASQKFLIHTDRCSFTFCLRIRMFLEFLSVRHLC